MDYFDFAGEIGGYRGIVGVDDGFFGVGCRSGEDRRVRDKIRGITEYAGG